ncbi:hypothetical protein SAY87_011040 [Trapa incisa]|uniref:UBA domain-containing protein n=1 Tax=Trapa incisa TaxID=236973 RepID=A0AAN7JIV6_9MYRT|nr:hypothetical protein SAY87_011040 [Trapa incisa]
MNGGPYGFSICLQLPARFDITFDNAPVTRAFFVASVISTHFLGILGRTARFDLSYQDIFQKFQLWKLLASFLTFLSTPELAFGLYLLYYFRVFERQIGLIRINYVGKVILIILCSPSWTGHSMNLTSGLCGLIFASFIPLYFNIPVSTRFQVFGVRFTGKFFTYLAGLQLLLSSWRRSIIPGICGIVASTMYRLNDFYIRKFKKNYPSAAASSSEPPEGSIATLLSMGFNRSSARQALAQARNDINTATNILLKSQSH